jgi:hypothetical protein
MADCTELADILKVCRNSLEVIPFTLPILLMANSNSFCLGKLGQEMATLDTEKSRQDVRFMIVGEYLDLYQTLNAQRILEQNYQVVENRYTNGLVLITDMLDASTLKLSADLKLVNAQIDLIYKYYQLKYLSHEL